MEAKPLHALPCAPVFVGIGAFSHLVALCTVCNVFAVSFVRAAAAAWSPGVPWSCQVGPVSTFSLFTALLMTLLAAATLFAANAVSPRLTGGGGALAPLRQAVVRAEAPAEKAAERLVWLCSRFVVFLVSALALGIASGSGCKHDPVLFRATSDVFWVASTVVGAPAAAFCLFNALVSWPVYLLVFTTSLLRQRCRRRSSISAKRE